MRGQKLFGNIKFLSDRCLQNIQDKKNVLQIPKWLKINAPHLKDYNNAHTHRSYLWGLVKNLMAHEQALWIPISNSSVSHCIKSCWIVTLYIKPITHLLIITNPFIASNITLVHTASNWIQKQQLVLQNKINLIYLWLIQSHTIQNL